MTPLISEAYLNEKKNLTRYYIGQSWRFTGLNQAFVLVILALIVTLLEDAFILFDLNSYILIIPFVIPQLIRSIQQPYTQLADSILTGTNHPNFLMLIRFIEENLKLLTMTTLVVWLRIPQGADITTIAWTLVCGEVAAIIFKTICCYIYIHRKIISLEIPWWQTFGAPFLSGFLLFSVGLFFKITVFDPMNATYGFLPAVVVIGIIFVSLSFGLYHPITTLFGGYDDDYLRHFEKAVKMSGPSKPIARVVYLEAITFRKFSKLHNRYKMDETEALKEAQELFLMKFAHLKTGK